MCRTRIRRASGSMRKSSRAWWRMKPCRTRTIRSRKSSAASMRCLRSCIRRCMKSWKKRRLTETSCSSGRAKTTRDRSSSCRIRTLSPRRERGSTRRFPATLPAERSGGAALRTQSAASWDFFRRVRSCCARDMSPNRTYIYPRPARRNLPGPAAASSWTSCGGAA